MLRKRLFLMLLFCLTVSFVRAQDNAACVVASGEPLRIGAVFPAQTLLSASAVTPYRGVVAMVAAVNACGGVAGHPVELVNVSANNRDSARAAVAKLSGDVPLIIGSGSPAVSEVLLEESQGGSFVYWEVSEPLDSPHQSAFSPLPTNSQLGSQTADFIQTQISTLLGDKQPLRLAIIHEKRPAAVQIADALSSTLTTPAVLTYAYDNVLSDSYKVAKEIREKKVNAVVVVAFNRDSDQFWLSMRQADANVIAYIQVGEPDRRNSCERIGNSDSLITVSRTGVVNNTYREQQIGSVYDQYTSIYMKQFALLPDVVADLSASNTYLLLHDILPETVDDFTVSNVQQKIQAAKRPVGSGLMGEGFTIEGTSAVNQAAVAIIQQRQDNRLCSLFPSDIATCSAGLQPFPTWRERVSQPQFASCVD
ncbi:MAG TPA: ABC transporter substrate-binding protein [Phototrophicaceae bacterium]|nr:ABC transporter substrate-binding protein [Phototrophicaceae bacterium]